MASAHAMPGRKNRFIDAVARVSSTDFCPGLNRFVYWLKEPVGIFVLAALVGLIIGLYVAPVGLVIAAVITSMIVVGVAWPWFAVRCVQCRLEPSVTRMHEGETCDLIFLIRNRLPIPVWGLAVEGYLDREAVADDSGSQALENSASNSVPSVALAFVRGLAVSRYRVPITPSMRGRYPMTQTTLTSSFPFGIWTAKRCISKARPVTVWPQVHPIVGELNPRGHRRGNNDRGDVAGGGGDVIGLREYRSGDSMRSVNWTATARSNDLIVMQRGGADKVPVAVTVDVSPTGGRHALADRIRVAASVFVNLHASDVPVTLALSDSSTIIRQRDVATTLDRLAEVPLDGCATVGNVNNKSAGSGQSVSCRHPTITVSANETANCVVDVFDPATTVRGLGQYRRTVFPPQVDGQSLRPEALASNVAMIWSGGRDARTVA